MITAAKIDAAADAAVAAIEAGDFATALTKARAAQTMLAALPDSRGQDNTEIRYDRNALQALVEQLERQQTATTAAALGGGIRRAKITFKRPTT